MTKKDLNQNAKFERDLLDLFRPIFFFVEKQLNKFTSKKNINNIEILNKAENYLNLKARLIQLRNVT